MASEIEEAGSGFRQFDVITDYSDHHYVKATGTEKKMEAANCFSNTKSGVYKKIMQEWKILEECLPETIFVRTYESRIDLLRAAIIGAQGTPYQDGLFFFDILFPEDYPNSPPKVHYISFGLIVNPHLYHTGRVCLSLLNTWIGLNKSEKWNPNSSSILQILVSIQALVLKNYSRTSDERAFTSTCKTMIFMLRHPPLHFNEFVTAHFMQRGCNILKAINAYKHGFPVAEYFYESGGKQQGSRVSKSFVKELDQLYKMLYTEFLRIKVPVHEGLIPSAEPKPAANRKTDSSDNNQNGINSEMNRNKKKTIFGYLFRKVKKIFKIKDEKSSSFENS